MCKRNRCMYQAVGDEDDARPNIRNAKRARTLTQPIAPKKDRYVKPNSTATLYSQSANYAARVDQTHQGKRESGVCLLLNVPFSIVLRMLTRNALDPATGGHLASSDGRFGQWRMQLLLRIGFCSTFTRVKSCPRRRASANAAICKANRAHVCI